MNVEAITSFDSSKYVQTVKDYLSQPDDEKMGEIGAVNFHLPYFEVFCKFLKTGLNQI